MIFGLAPMDGITDLAYRMICKEIFETYNTSPSHSLRMWTEFMNADGYMITPHKLIKHMMHLKGSNQHLIAQIYGGNEETLVQTAQDLAKKYPDLTGIELNIGCPSPKVIACGGGSGMMQNQQQTLHTIKALRTTLSKPFSIKVRTGLTTDDKSARFDFLLDTSKYCDTISIHGRTFKQGHSGDNDRQYIYDFKKKVGNTIKVIGNGGICSYQDSLEKVGNLDGIMIGQYAIGNPRIFVPHTPTMREIYQRVKRHLNLALSLELYRKQHIDEPNNDELSQNKAYLHALKHYDPNSDHHHPDFHLSPHTFLFPMPKQTDIETIIHQLPTYDFSNKHLTSPIEFRKYLFNYIKGIPGSKEFKQHICTIKHIPELYQAIDRFFQKF